MTDAMPASAADALTARRAEADSQLERAVAARDLAMSRLEAIRELETRRHATARERLLAEQSVQVSQARLQAAEAMQTLLQSAVSLPDDQTVHRVRGSRFAILPAASERLPETEPAPSRPVDSLASEPTIDLGPDLGLASEPHLAPEPGLEIESGSAAQGEEFVSTPAPSASRLMLNHLLRREADTHAGDAWWGHERDRAAAYRDAMVSLHGERHATNAERDAAVAASADVEAAIAGEAARKNDLRALANGASMAAPSLDDPLAAAGHALAASPDLAPALLAAASQLTDADVALAAAEGEAWMQAELLALVEALPQSARNPRELETAVRNRDQSAAAIDATRSERDLAAGAMELLVALGNEAVHDWSGLPLETTSLPSPELSADADPLALSEDRLLLELSLGQRRRGGTNYYDAARPIAQRYELGSPHDPVTTLPLVGTYGLGFGTGLNQGSVASPGSTYLFQPGATYRSGYSFGQMRRDLPRELRYPRADSYGGPWSLPGSPTDRLRYRYRTPLRWGW